MPSRSAQVTAVDAMHVQVRLWPQCDTCAAQCGRCAHWLMRRDTFRLPRASAPEARIGDHLRLRASEQGMRRMAVQQFGGLSLGALLGAAAGASLAPRLAIVTDGMSLFGALSGMVMAWFALRVLAARRRDLSTWLNVEVIHRPL
jgi:hypothetical protein